jgi:D-alanine-D-alanine ligase
MSKRFEKVAVLKGGISSERAVSLRSGAAIAQGLRDGGYEVVEIDVKEKDFEIPADVEAVFVALHGRFGEDGGVQQILEKRGVFYTGSGVASCEVAFDKILTRERLEENGVAVPPGEVVKSSNARKILPPLVVKPPREGSSVGCHLVMNEADWSAAFADTQAFSDQVLVEKYIPGRELTVGIVEQGDGLQVLPVVEIRTAGEWYDFDAKYVTGETEYVVPAKLDADLTDKIQAMALKSFQCLEAEGFGRVDFRLSPEGELFVLELNSIPGFTATSLLPKAARAAGIGFSELCCRIMESAHL